MTPAAGNPAPRPGEPARPDATRGSTPSEAVVVPITATRAAERPGAASVAASKVARMLATIGSTSSLHHRTVPGTTAVLDHLVVAPGGIVAVISSTSRGPISVSRSALDIDGVDRTDLVVQIEQLAAAITAMAEGLVVESHVCLVDGDFVESGPKRCRDTDVSGLAGLRRRIEMLRVVRPGGATHDVAALLTRFDARLHPRP